MKCVYLLTEPIDCVSLGWHFSNIKVETDIFYVIFAFLLCPKFICYKWQVYICTLYITKKHYLWIFANSDILNYCSVNELNWCLYWCAYSLYEKYLDAFQFGVLLGIGSVGNEKNLVISSNKDLGRVIALSQNIWISVNTGRYGKWRWRRGRAGLGPTNVPFLQNNSECAEITSNSSVNVADDKIIVLSFGQLRFRALYTKFIHTFYRDRCIKIYTSIYEYL